MNWQLKLSWPTEYNTYQTRLEVSGNPAEVKFQTGGTLRIRVAVLVEGKEYSARAKVSVIGANPGKEQLTKELDSDFLRAIAWEESTWRQFDAKGQPLLPKVRLKKGQKIPAMRGLFQISEWWWGKDKRISHADYNRVAWQWKYNIETAREILSLLHNLVISRYPNESRERQWDRTIKAFTVGEKSIYTKQIPDNFWYVVRVKKTLKEKPWRK